MFIRYVWRYSFCHPFVVPFTHFIIMTFDDISKRMDFAGIWGGRRSSYSSHTSWRISRAVTDSVKLKGVRLLQLLKDFLKWFIFYNKFIAYKLYLFNWMMGIVMRMIGRERWWFPSEWLQNGVWEMKLSIRRRNMKVFSEKKSNCTATSLQVTASVHFHFPPLTLLFPP